MSARVERTVPAKRIRTEKVVVNFDAEHLKAPFALRCGAILIDYILLVGVLALSYLLSYTRAVIDAKWNTEIMNIGWLVVLLLILTNFVLFPLINGKSIGKMLTGLRIVKIDGNAPSLVAVLLRHLIGYPLSFLIFGLGFLLPVFNEKGRALHDFLAGTVVVYGKQKKVIRDS
ncbi:hypothetical protein BH20ACI1_BH20ACI1_21270 [soil metagenome]